jgi:hypothetical protein
MYQFQRFVSFLIPSEKKKFLVASLTSFAPRQFLERIVTADQTRVYHNESSEYGLETPDITRG